MLHEALVIYHSMVETFVKSIKASLFGATGGINVANRRRDLPVY